MRQAQFEDAAALWTRISTAAPQDIEPRMAMARIHLRGGRPLDALDMLAGVLQDKPNHAEARKLRSRIAHDQVSRIANRLDSGNARELDLALEALALRLGDDPYLERVRSYGVLIAAAEEAPKEKEPRQKSRSANPRPTSDHDLPAIGFLTRLNELGRDVPDKVLDDIRRQGMSLMRENVWLAHAIAAFHIKRGDLESARAAYSDAHTDEVEFWLEAAGRAADWKDADSALEFCTRASRCPDIDRSMLGTISEKLINANAADAAAVLWRSLPDYRNDVTIAMEIVDLLAKTERFGELVEECRRTLESAAPFVELRELQMRALVAVVRILRRVVMRERMEEQIAPLYGVVLERDDGSALAAWVSGAIASARIDHDAAIRHFEDAKSRGQLPKNLRVDLDGEIALLHTRLHRYGDAHVALQRMAPDNIPSGEYTARLKRVRDIAEFCGPDSNPLFPENLIDIVFEEVAKKKLEYEPQHGHLLTVSSSLRQGGSERQTVTVLGGLAADARVRKAILALRSTEGEDRAPFLRHARELPIDLVFYGENWQKNSDLRVDLPQLSDRPRLAAAIDFMPRILKEDIVRLSKLILSERPQAVHLRQDLFAAAIACALTGVPCFAIHRGSLSPDLWGHGELETNLHLRPMQHTYRHLLALPNFLMINNSSAGLDTDKNWTGSIDNSRFRVVHNAVEFEKLGSNAERNNGLRASLGVGPDDFLIGGVFRVTAVKRPMLWIETARIVAESRSDVHFAILGDGDMGAAMRDYAHTHGFGDRLHMPGLVSDVGAWYRALDINLLTSDREGLPNVLIEGQHFGVPAVSADVGGAFETLDEGVTGFLIPPDAGAMAYSDAILRILGDTGWRQEARTHGPAFVHAKFGMERAVDAVLESLGMA
ncbi:MAG TPA: glycosyltransferase [Rhizomicrobium sp.]|nr:glycosyltransferase [Rhizomicrobium sp.]